MQNSGGGFLHPSLFRRVELRVNQTTCDYRVNNLYNGYASRYRQTEGGRIPVIYIVRVTDHFDSLDAHPSKLVVFTILVVLLYPIVCQYIPLCLLFLLFKSCESHISLTKLPSLTISNHGFCWLYPILPLRPLYFALVQPQ